MPISGFSLRVREGVRKVHGRIPLIRVLPLSVVSIILAVLVANALVWSGAGIALRAQSGGALISTAVLSYTLGLRHALDADHISAIDLMTRRLVAAGQQPVTVGMFFSLGHSTIVIITSIVVAATAGAISDKFDAFGTTGGIIGTSISAAFLIVLGIVNIYILYKLVHQLRKVLRSSPDDDSNAFSFDGAGCLFTILKGMFRLIDRPWKMYPLGVMFGLGFDTSSEIALLGISSIEATKGTNIWIILCFPVLFTAGMCLLDTTDGALMMALYTSTARSRDPITVLYFSVVLTGITIVAASAIGFIQFFTIILNVAKPTGAFWDGIAAAGDNFDIIGGAISASFILFGGISVLLYRPWRRYVDKRRPQVDMILSTIAEDNDKLPASHDVECAADGPPREPTKMPTETIDVDVEVVIQTI